MRYRFSDYVLDDRTVELTRSGVRITLEPLVFQVLELLLRNRERVVTKDELLQTIWSGKVVTEATLTNAVKLARQAVGDDGQSQQVIRTVRGRGYRLVADVLETGADIRTVVETSLELPASGLPDIPRVPSVAVLGFRSLAGEHHDAVFCDGLATDLNTRLARLHGLFVIAHESAAQFSSQRNRISEVGRQLGVRYLVDGAAQRSDRRVRVTVNLVETEHQEVLWSEHFDRLLDDVFAVQDDIVDAIASALLPEIERAEMERARLVPTENLDAWECYHRAMWHNFRFTAEDSAEAQKLLLRASQLDVNFARAYAGLSFNQFLHAFLDTDGDTRGHIERSLDYAERSVSLDERDAMTHWVLGRALFLRQQHDQAIRSLDRALLANPNYAQGRYARGFVSAHSGREALTDLDAARRLSPFDPLLFAMKSSRGVSLAVHGDVEEASRWAVEATDSPNAHFHIHAIAGACLNMNGQRELAKHAIGRACAMHPGYSIAVFEQSFPQKYPDHRELFRHALREAGLPIS